MPRALTALLLVLAGPLPALDFGATEPTWTLVGPSAPVVPGQGFDVKAEVVLPEGYYQDQESEFLTWEPAPGSRWSVVGRSGSQAQLRGSKKSYSGTFTLVRTVVVPVGTSPGPNTLKWALGWQICQIDGVCLLPARSSAEVTVTVAATEGPTGSLGSFLWAAFLGGLVLNLMPCVFPVLALKGLGLAGSAGQSRRQRRRDALAFGGGTVTTLSLLGLVTAVAAWGGQRLDWGFAFQSWEFVWGLAALFWLLCLQLWGLWTWAWSPFSLTTRTGGPWRSFTGGALLVLTAAPCTAPFLGPALGFAFTLPPWWILPFFFAAGLGMAAPVLVVGLFPDWGRWLPNPGPWMVVVERIAGGVLTLTVAYLLWILGTLTAPGRVAWAVGVLLVVTALLIVGRRLGMTGRKATVGVLVTVLAGSLFVAQPVGSAPLPVVEGWVPYSRAGLDQALAGGATVLVDGTAAWCATCQVNELAVLNRPDVRALLKAKGVVTLRADYTRPNPEVQGWLQSVDRAGLPVYALYRPGLPVWVFPELLTDTNFVSVIAGLSP